MKSQRMNSTKLLEQGRPDMTFAVDWALSNNYLSIYLRTTSGKGTTPGPDKVRYSGIKNQQSRTGLCCTPRKLSQRPHPRRLDTQFPDTYFKTRKIPPQAEWIPYPYNAKHHRKAHGLYRCQIPRGQEDTPCESGGLQTWEMHIVKYSCICI